MPPEFSPVSDTSNHPSSRHSRWLLAMMIVLLVGIASLGYGWFLTTPPATFPADSNFEVSAGMSARTIADAAAAEGLVRSPFLLFIILVNQYDPTQIFAGTYRFTTPLSVFGVAAQLASRNPEADLVRLTFPEGITRHTMADIAATTLAGVSQSAYLEATKDLEGYLFPETYFVPTDFTAVELVDLQTESAATVIESITIPTTGTVTTTADILTLASILEREANDESSMRMVSGILQNRLNIGMALQADATIEYVLDTPLNELPPGALAEELRALDSPYNTYLYPGLPPTPIGNPGEMAINAVVNPTPSNYFFYITGTDGVFYYAETLDQHNENIARHLR